MNLKLSALVLMAALLTACETVVDRREMLDAQEELIGVIKEEFGIDSRVGLSIENGVLIEVSFGFEAHEVADLQISEIERIVRFAVRKSFSNKPRAIYIQIVTTAE